MSCSDIIAICDLAITGIAGGFIAYYLGKRQSDSRATKDYFIGCITDFSQGYANFFSRLFSHSTPSLDIQTWFKMHTMVAGAINKSIKKHYKNKVDFAQVLEINNKLKQFITDTDEFNNQYQNKSGIQFSNATITRLTEFMAEINEEISNTIISINRR